MLKMPVGLYEKALPAKLSWEERLAAAGQAGYDYIDISIDESDERLSRLDWTASERAALRRAIANTGVRVDTVLGRDILKDAGAEVDASSNIVRFPRQFVEDCLRMVPKEVTLGGRRPGADLPLNGEDCTLCLDGEGPFVLDRDTGEPFLPVEERPVPQITVEGEVLSPTQPFPVAPPAIVPNTISSEDAFGITWFDRRACQERIDSSLAEGLYTPPSEQGTRGRYLRTTHRSMGSAVPTCL